MILTQNTLLKKTNKQKQNEHLIRSHGQTNHFREPTEPEQASCTSAVKIVFFNQWLFIFNHCDTIVYSELVRNLSAQRTCCKINRSDWSDRFIWIWRTAKIEPGWEKINAVNSSSENTRSVWTAALLGVSENNLNAQNWTRPVCKALYCVKITLACCPQIWSSRTHLDIRADLTVTRMLDLGVELRHRGWACSTVRFRLEDQPGWWIIK